MNEKMEEESTLFLEDAECLDPNLLVGAAANIGATGK